METRLAQAVGLSKNRLEGDAAKSNLATIREMKSDDAAMMAPLQDHQGRHVAAEVRRRWTKQAVALGVISSVSADQYLRQMYRFNRLLWIGPGSGAPMSPEEVQATIDRMRSGLSTYPQECARGGNHWKRQLRTMAKVNKVAKELDVVLDWTKGQGIVPDSATSIAGDEQRDAAGPARPPAKKPVGQE
jgi:capsid protein